MQRRFATFSRPWRLVFALYALAMMIGAHWPRLEMALGGQRAPDKIIHMLAFAGLTFLLWRTRWLGAGWRLAAVLVGWVLAMEVTQSLPVLGRRFSWLDIVAGWAGVALALAWIRAMQPIGGTLNRMRQQNSEFVLDELFLQWRAWLLGSAAGLVMAIIAGGAAIAIVWRVHPDGILYTAFLAVPAAGVGGAYAAIDLLWRRERDHAAERRPCIFCGESCATASFDEHGIGACPACHRPVHLGQWLLRAHVTRTTIVRLCLWPAAIAIALGALAIIVYVIGLALYLQSPSQFSLLRRADAIPMETQLVLDTTIIGVILAIAAHRFRAALARIIDRQHERCRRCGHDVHATASPEGVGRCPECATPFIRLNERAHAALSAVYGKASRQSQRRAHASDA